MDLVRDEIGIEEDLVRMGRVGRFCALASLVVAGASAMPASALADGNVAPTVTAYPINTTFAEPMIELGMAVISDPDSSSFTCSINYGDGTPSVPGSASDTVCSWPEHRYMASGTYTITVTVTDNWGASGEGTVAVTYTNAAPGVAVPSLFGTPQTGSPVHASAVFLDFGTGDDAGTPVFETYTCAFDYGDGSPIQTGTYVPRSPGQLPTCVGPDHVYQAPGAYAITATVTDSGGAAGSRQTTVTIASVPDSGPVLTVPPTSHPMVTEGFPVTLPWALFDPAPDLPYSMHVDWGDGSSEDLTSATSPAEIDLTHTYAASDRVGAPGYSLYTATLTVTDARGATASASQQVTVINLAPVITAPATITVPEGPATTITLATFTDASVGPWEVYVSTSDGRALHLTYQTPSAIQVPWDPSWGNVTVTISVWDRGLMGSTATASIVMGNSAPAVGQISFYQDTQPAEGQLFAAVATFTDPGLSSLPGSETYTCTVDYGDGTGPQAGGVDGGICYGPVHTYSAPGSYVISVVVTDSRGGSGWSSLPVTVANVAPTVGPVYVDGRVSEGQTATAAAPFSDPGIAGETYTCTVDYGDGSGPVPGVVDGSGCLGPSHVYVRVGVLTVTVTVTDSNGGSGSNSVTVNVGSAVPSVGPVVVPESLVEGQAFVATASFTSSSPQRCTVDFGNGTGTPRGSISGSTCSAPNYAYPAAGTYTLTFTITDTSGASASAQATVVVGNVPPVVENAQTWGTPSVGGTVTAHATFHDPALGIETYTCTVDFGDGSGPQPGVIGDADCTADHTYSEGGLYTVTVTVTDSNGGSGSASTSLPVANLSPTVGPISISGSAVEGGFVQASATFTDPWSAANSNLCTIDYGDGSGTFSWATSDQTCLAPTHSYARPGTFTVWLAVDRGYGALGTSTTTITIANVTPVVAPDNLQTFGPAGAPWAASVTFTDPGYGSGESYTCTVNYGDGTGVQPGTISGNLCTGPDHSYASKGTYTLVATVTDSNGGAGTYSVPIVVYNPAPTITSAMPSVTTYPGASLADWADYISTGLSPAETCTVNYGDGSGSMAGVADGSRCQGPAHTYSTRGTYTATMTITAANGATASTSATVVVGYPPISVGPISIPARVVEGDTVTASAPFTPIGKQTYRCTVDYGDGAGAQTGTIGGTTCKGPSHKYAIPGDYTLTITVTGSKGYAGSASVAVSVINAVPGSVTPSFAQTLLKLGSTATLTVKFVEPGTGETYLGTVYWGDGTQSTVTVTGATRQFSVSHRYAQAGCYYVWVSVTEPSGQGEMVPVPTMPNAPDSSIVVYDPARKVSGSGKLSSSADACLLTKACKVASTASFSLSGSYASGATKPTVSFSYTAAGFSFSATSADLMVASQGRVTIRGTGKVNGVSGYSFLLVASDGNPDTLWLVVSNARTGQLVYQGVEGQALLSGSISIR